MKELLIVVRREKALEVKNLLSNKCLPFVSGPVRGKGKEGGLGYKTNKGVLISMMPKILIITWVEETLYREVIEEVIEIAHTGFHGDGKIFVLGGSL